jgi:hypothetical protein
MPVSKFVCEATYAPGFASSVASSMDGDVPWDTRSIIKKTLPAQSHQKREFRNTYAHYFIAEHSSKKLAVGVEVRNTLPVIEREESGIKLEICEHFGHHSAVCR